MFVHSPDIEGPIKRSYLLLLVRCLHVFWCSLLLLSVLAVVAEKNQNALTCQERLGFSRENGHVELLTRATLGYSKNMTSILGSDGVVTPAYQVVGADVVRQSTERFWTVALINTVRDARDRLAAFLLTQVPISKYNQTSDTAGASATSRAVRVQDLRGAACTCASEASRQAASHRALVVFVAADWCIRCAYTHTCTLTYTGSGYARSLRSGIGVC